MGVFSDAAGFKVNKDRQARQDEMTALQMNMEQGPNGMQYNEQGQMQKDLEKEQLKATIDAQQAQLRAQESRTNSDDMKSIMDSITNNDFNGAKHKLKRNPTLQKKLAGKALDVHDFGAINFDTDMHLFKQSGLGFENVDLNDPKIREALNSSYFKVRGADGKDRLTSTSDVYAQTNMWADMDARERDRYTERMNYVNSTLKGSGITTAQQRAKRLEAGIKEQELKLKGEQLTSAQEFQTEIATARKNGASPAELMTIMDKYNPQRDGKTESASVSALNYAKAKYYLGQGKKDSSGGAGSAAKLIATYDAEYPNATPEERMSYVDKVMKKSVTTGSHVAQEEDTKELNKLQSGIIGKEAPADKKARESENLSLEKLDTKLKASVMKARDMMEGNFNTFTAIDRITKEYSTGDLVVDKDAVANVTTYLSKLFGNDVPQELANANFNTASGMVLAQYMKDISGTAVGVAEAARLTALFQGGDLADETFVHNAMKKFSSELKEKNKVSAKTNKMYMPYSTKRFSPTEAVQYPLGTVATNKNGDKLTLTKDGWVKAD